MWAAQLEKGNKYKQDNDCAYHVTMAALEPNESKKGIVQVFVDTAERKNTLLCSLRFPDILQVPLDLMFEEGSEVFFHIKGDGKVHLSGYILPEEMAGGFDPYGEYDDEDEEVSELSDEEEMDQMLGLKRKNEAATKQEPATKKAKATNGTAQPAKGDAKATTNGKQNTPKPKQQQLAQDSDEDDDEEESSDEELDEAELQRLVANIKQKKATQAGGDESSEDDEEDDEDDSDDVAEQQAALKAKLKDVKGNAGATPKQKPAEKAPQQQQQQSGKKNQGQNNNKPQGGQNNTPGNQKKGGFGGFKNSPGNQKSFTPGNQKGNFNKTPGKGGNFNKNNKPVGKWSANKQRN